MYDLSKTIWYKNNSIDYDDFGNGRGVWTVFWAGNDIMFNTVKEAKAFIDEMDDNGEL